MKELVLNAEELKELLSFAQELPTKYGMPLITFVNNVAKRQAPAPEAEVEATETESK